MTLLVNTVTEENPSSAASAKSETARLTLIAALIPNSHPMLLGDLLISEHERDGAPLSPFRPTLLPSVGLTAPTDPNASSQIVTTRQKLVLITDNLAIGWSGSYPVAKRIVAAMLDHFSPGPTTLGDVNAFIATCDYDDIYRSDLALVGFCLDGDEFQQFGWNAHKVHLPFFNTGVVAGGGAKPFVDLCRSLAHQGIHISSSDVPEPSVALGKSLFITGMLTANEIYDNINLTIHRFGGFYESMFLMGGAFKRCGDVLFTYSQFTLDKQDNNKGVFRPLLLVKVEYARDVLLIRRIDVNNSDQSTADDATLVVQPVYRDVSRDEVDGIWRLDMNATHYCHVVFVVQDGPWGFIVNPQVSPSVPSIKITEKDDGTRHIAFHDNLLMTIFQQLSNKGILTAKDL